MLERGLSRYLIAADIVGNRVFPEILPERYKIPAIVYSITAIDGTNSHDGNSCLDFASVQFAILDSTAEGAREVADLVLTAMGAYRENQDNDYVYGTLALDRGSLQYEPTTSEYRVVQEYRVMFQPNGRRS